MDGESESLICTNADCNFADTGKCVEGNDISECTYLERTDQVSSALEEEEPFEEPTDSQIVWLGNDGPLSLSEASALMKSAHTPVVAFLGPVAAGKTSLIAEVYDAFQYSQYERLAFAGSLTLTAFEQISHAVRAASRTHVPAPDRTDISSDPSLYHLRIRSDQRPVNILMADRSGETYRQLSDTPSIGRDLLELRRADILNVLIDGETLCDGATRANAIAQCAQSLQALALTDTLMPEAEINLILTKLDKVDSDENAADAHHSFDSLPGRIEQQCQGKLRQITTHKIAACPHNLLYKKGYGVEALVTAWLRSKPIQGVYSQTTLLAERRQFDCAPCSLEAFQ